MEEPLQDELPKQVEENHEASNDETIIPDEILEAIPEEDRGKITSIIKQTMFQGVMSRGNPISSKITTEHITQLISRSDTHDLRDREERKSQRYYNLVVLLIGLIFLGFLIIFLKEDKELLYKIIIAIISFVGGFGIGKTSQKKSSNED